MAASRSLAIARHEFRVLRSDPAYFVIFTVMPLVVMAFFKPSLRFAVAAENGSSANGAEQAVPGITVMFSLFLISNIGFTFFREHGWGTWERLRSSWATTSELMFGKMLVPLFQAAVQMVLLFVLGSVLYGLRVRGSLLALVVVASAFWLCAVAMGLALLAICKTAMQVNSIANLGAIVLAGIGGAITPSTSLPAGVRFVAPVTPTYWAMRGFGDVILDGGGLGEVALPVIVLLGFTGVFLLVAAVRFRMEETKTSWA